MEESQVAFVGRDMSAVKFSWSREFCFDRSMCGPINRYMTVADQGRGRPRHSRCSSSKRWRHTRHLLPWTSPCQNPSHTNMIWDPPASIHSGEQNSGRLLISSCHQQSRWGVQGVSSLVKCDSQARRQVLERGRRRRAQPSKAAADANRRFLATRATQSTPSCQRTPHAQAEHLQDNRECKRTLAGPFAAQKHPFSLPKAFRRATKRPAPSPRAPPHLGSALFSYTSTRRTSLYPLPRAISSAESTMPFRPTLLVPRITALAVMMTRALRRGRARRGTRFRAG